MLPLTLLLAGCASQGPLRPPSLNLPAAVRGLTATRTGNTVELLWTNPVKTSDGVALTLRHRGAGPLTAEVCRGEQAPGVHCTPVARVAVTAGSPGRFSETLPAPLASGAARPLHYAVRIVNAAKAGAVWTGAATLAGAAPSPVMELRAFPVGRGIALRWTPETTPTGTPVLRVEHGAGKPVLLKIAGDATGDPGGALDTTGHAGQAQHYTVFRESNVTVGKETYTMRSTPAEVNVSATAPMPLPPPPTGLQAMVNTLGKPEVDLVWDPADDASVIGFVLFRQEDVQAPVKLTPQPVTGFTFVDGAAQAGHTYTYRVSAVNGTGQSTPAVATAVLP